VTCLLPPCHAPPSPMCWMKLGNGHGSWVTKDDSFPSLVPIGSKTKPLVIAQETGS